ncbi:MAG TPA: formate dehydrogenase subunit gamma [Steroidobacteraceae bacterium]|jgi:formate dehydrogenase subunit gamma|nr:formate dehydrogenase subunit gamma [Steroidobacteraceae bacterium]
MSATAIPAAAFDEQRILAIVERHRHQDGPLIEILHDVQAEFGCVPQGAVATLARALNLSRAEVYGVVTFYHHFRTKPPGRRVLQICRAESCQAAGGRALEKHAVARLGVGFGGTTPDGRMTLEAVYCLGLCACSPAAMLDGEVHGRLTKERLDALLDADAAVKA